MVASSALRVGLGALALGLTTLGLGGGLPGQAQSLPTLSGGQPISPQTALKCGLNERSYALGTVLAMPIIDHVQGEQSTVYMRCEMVAGSSDGKPNPQLTRVKMPGWKFYNKRPS
jgi:hypothetical protein